MTDDDIRMATESGEAQVAFWRNRCEELRQKMLVMSRKHRRAPVHEWAAWRDAYWRAEEDWKYGLYQLEKAKANVQS